MGKFQIEKDGKVLYPLTELANKIMKTDLSNKEERDCKWNLCIALKLSGTLDMEKLQTSFERIISENDALHSKICMVYEEYYLYIADSYDFRLKKRQVDSIKTAIHESRIFGSIPMDIVSQIPLDVVVYSVNEMENLLLIKTHHVITDATSLILIVKNFIKYYSNPDEICNSSFGSYLEFMQEEQLFETTQKANNEIDYWKKEFQGYSPIRFPIDNLSTNGPSYNIANFSFHSKKLQRLAKQEKTSVFNLVLATFHLAFAKVNHVSDTAINYLFENRMNSKYQGTIGCLTRAIANRYVFDDDEVIGSIHKKMRTKISTGFNNRKKSLQYDYFMSDFIISYQTINETRSSYELDGGKLELYPIMLVRNFPWLFILITETEEKISVFFSCDLRKFNKEYLEKLKTACIEAEKFICSMPEKTFVEFINGTNEECENNGYEDNFILI